MEYAGSISDYHFEEAREEWYQAEMQEHTNEVIEKYLGSEYRIETNNLASFAPYGDLDLIMEEDEDETNYFIIDADGTVLIELEYHFFRLERQE